MEDPFNILGPEFDVPPSFEEAVRSAVARLEETAARFEQLQSQIPEERYTDEEWQVVEGAASDLVEHIERAEESYVAVMYDSHAWYRIIESLDTISRRLQSAIGIMERVQVRQTNGTGS